MPVVIAVILIMVVVAIYISGRLVIAAASPQPATVGRPGELAPCPPSPNCVSSLADPSDTEHVIAPIAYSDSAEEAQARLVTVLQGIERMTPVREEPGYVHVIFRSNLWGFVDDAEFVFDEDAQQIHLRIAARLGYSDLGVNRQYSETIRAAMGG